MSGRIIDFENKPNVISYASDAVLIHGKKPKVIFKKSPSVLFLTNPAKKAKKLTEFLPVI